MKKCILILSMLATAGWALACQLKDAPECTIGQKQCGAFGVDSNTKYKTTALQICTLESDNYKWINASDKCISCSLDQTECLYKCNVVKSQKCGINIDGSTGEMDGYNLYVCNENGEWEMDKSCDGECSDETGCVGKGCNDGDVRCASNSLLVCEGGTYKSKLCSSGICAEGECKNVNADESCNHEESHDVCNDNLAMHCDVNNRWVADNCDSYSKICVDGMCKDIENGDRCDPTIHQYICKDDTVLQCVDNRWRIENCGEYSTCKDGKCKCDSTQKIRICVDDKLKTCNDNGEWDEESCGEGKACYHNECVSAFLIDSIEKLNEYRNLSDDKRGMYKRIIFKNEINLYELTKTRISEDGCSNPKWVSLKIPKDVEITSDGENNAKIYFALSNGQRCTLPGAFFDTLENVNLSNLEFDFDSKIAQGEPLFSQPDTFKGTPIFGMKGVLVNQLLNSSISHVKYTGFATYNGNTNDSFGLVGYASDYVLDYVDAEYIGTVNGETTGLVCNGFPVGGLIGYGKSGRISNCSVRFGGGKSWASTVGFGGGIGVANGNLEISSTQVFINHNLTADYLYFGGLVGAIDSSESELNLVMDNDYVHIKEIKVSPNTLTGREVEAFSGGMIGLMTGSKRPNLNISNSIVNISSPMAGILGVDKVGLSSSSSIKNTLVVSSAVLNAGLIENTDRLEMSFKNVVVVSPKNQKCDTLLFGSRNKNCSDSGIYYYYNKGMGTSGCDQLADCTNGPYTASVLPALQASSDGVKWESIEFSVGLDSIYVPAFPAGGMSIEEVKCDFTNCRP